jgi:hypothetical protein
MREQH